MAALEHFQHKVANLEGVKVVIGPQAATKRVEPLQELGNSVLASQGNIGPVKELGKLGKELNVAAGGVGALREGISEAGDGAGLLALGSEHATEGAQLIARGLGRATSGSQRAIDALERFAKGSEKLAEFAARSGDRGAADPRRDGVVHRSERPLQRPAPAAQAGPQAARRGERNAAAAAGAGDGRASKSCRRRKRS